MKKHSGKLQENNGENVLFETENLEGIALDWAVASILFDKIPVIGFVEGRREQRLGYIGTADHKFYSFQTQYHPSTSWHDGGPIIEKEKIAIDFMPLNNMWIAQIDDGVTPSYIGSTPLIAAMRCYVASKLGDKLEIPEYLEGGVK